MYIKQKCVHQIEMSISNRNVYTKQKCLDQITPNRNVYNKQTKQKCLHQIEHFYMKRNVYVVPTTVASKEKVKALYTNVIHVGGELQTFPRLLKTTWQKKKLLLRSFSSCHNVFNSIQYLNSFFRDFPQSCLDIVCCRKRANVISYIKLCND